MRSALLKVKGVTRAQVRLEQFEVVVTYDPAVATVDAMIKAIGDAEHPLQGRGAYTAKVKT